MAKKLKKIILIWKSNGLDLFILSFIPYFRIRRHYLFLVSISRTIILGNISYTNIASNILLNLIVYLLRVTLTKVPDYCYIFPLEIAVIFGEWKIYHLFFPNKKRLFLLTALANVFSFAIGLLIFGL